ncbi:MAG: hypothetical protein K0Q79_3668 [Flavipsychrobacter sp.]|jgi:hypothetical protein|nr:hypothetical protein [Flavipsychrobacter sp.]
MNRLLSLSAVIVLASVCYGFKPVPASCIRTVYFGDPTQDICVGRGVCKNTYSVSENPGGIPVNFHILPSDPNILVMTFSLSDLQNNQKSQVAYFTAASASYNFQSTYIIPQDMVQELNLQPNAQITPNSPSVIEINGDVVNNYITYSHN